LNERLQCQLKPTTTDTIRCRNISIEVLKLFCSGKLSDYIISHIISCHFFDLIRYNPIVGPLEAEPPERYHEHTRPSGWEFSSGGLGVLGLFSSWQPRSQDFSRPFPLSTVRRRSLKTQLFSTVKRTIRTSSSRYFVENVCFFSLLFCFKICEHF